MDHLLRSIAPMSGAAWEVVDGEARQRLATQLAARKLVDFSGPHGWDHAAVSLSRTEELAAPAKGLRARVRRVQPLVELRCAFTVDRAEAEDAARGAADVSLEGLVKAARDIAHAENVAVFHGYEAAGIRGITGCSSHEPLEIGSDFERYPNVVAHAVEVLRRSGVGGPYGLAIGPEGYNGIIERTEHGGYLLLDHLRQILGGPLVWAPGVEGAVVLSLRGGDFVLTSGQDLSIGYQSHDEASISLFLEESFTFRVLEPDAALHLHRAA